MAGTPFDLRKPVLIGDCIHKVPQVGNELPGFDHNYCLGGNEEKQLAAR